MMANFASQLLSKFSLGKMFTEDRTVRLKKKKLSQMESTVTTLLWAHRKLSLYVVEDKAVHFILDTDFIHYVMLEKSVEFISNTFDKMKETDWFGLFSLGCQTFSIELEKKSSNGSVKRKVLSTLS